MTRLMLYLAAVVIVALAVLIPFMAEEAMMWIGEGLVAILALMGVTSYIKVIRQMRALNIGVELLNAQDFNSRLAKVGQKDADNIGSIFNAMLEALKNERIHTLEQNDFLNLLIDASPMGLVIFHYDGTVKSANHAAERMLGFRCVPGSPLNARMGGLGAEVKNLKVGETKTVRLNDTRMIRCEKLSFLDNGFHRPFLLLESLSEEVRKAERDAYGKVIRQIAHEVNITMAGSLSAFDFIAAATPDEETKEIAEACTDRWQSLSAFIKAYVEMVKLPKPQLQKMEVNALIESMLPFLESLAHKYDVKIELNLAEDPIELDADSVLLEHAIINIVKNGCESIGRSGIVTISTVSNPKMLDIADSGHGISKEVAENLFAPFYSTKKGGQGIGLMLVSEIFRNHGYGFKLYTSDKDGLTHFRVNLQQG